MWNFLEGNFLNYKNNQSGGWNIFFKLGFLSANHGEKISIRNDWGLLLNNESHIRINNKINQIVSKEGKYIFRMKYIEKDLIWFLELNNYKHISMNPFKELSIGNYRGETVIYVKLSSRKETTNSRALLISVLRELP